MMRRPATLVGLAIAVLAMSAVDARAEHAQVRLSYASAKSPASCPDEATFRGLVAARLGYDPFVNAEVRRLSVSYEQRGSEVVGRVELSAEGDAKPLNRSLRAAGEECFELATSLALVVAVAVDPNALSAAQPATTPSVEPPPAAPAPEPAAVPATKNPEPVPAPAVTTPPASEKVEKTGTVLRLSVGGLLGVGIVPAVTPGARVGAALGWGAWSVGLEGAFFAAGARQHAAGSGAVRGYAVAGSLVPCVSPARGGAGRLELCAVGSVGALRATAREVTRAAPTSTLQASVGPRVAGLVALTRSVAVGISAEAPVAISRTHLFIAEGGEKSEVWQQPAVGFIFAASVVASIW